MITGFFPDHTAANLAGLPPHLTVVWTGKGVAPLTSGGDSIRTCVCYNNELVYRHED